MKIIPGSIERFVNNPESDPQNCTLPMWTNDNSLLYISDKTGFWNVWIARNENERTNLTPVNEDIGDPLWKKDNRNYNYSSIRDEIVVVRKGGKLEWNNIDGSDSKIVEY